MMALSAFVQRATTSSAAAGYHLVRNFAQTPVHVVGTKNEKCTPSSKAWGNVLRHIFVEPWLRLIAVRIDSFDAHRQLRTNPRIGRDVRQRVGIGCYGTRICGSCATCLAIVAVVTGACRSCHFRPCMYWTLFTGCNLASPVKEPLCGRLAHANGLPSVRLLPDHNLQGTSASTLRCITCLHRRCPGKHSCRANRNDSAQMRGEMAGGSHQASRAFCAIGQSQDSLFDSDLRRGRSCRPAGASWSHAACCIASRRGLGSPKERKAKVITLGCERSRHIVMQET